jgi:hypothetical protein
MEDQGFAGMSLGVNPYRLRPNQARLDINGDFTSPLAWKVRSGRARAALARFTGICRNVVYFADRGGVNRLFYFMDSTGKLEGTTMPGSDWSPVPATIGGAGFTFSPVTALTVSDATGLTLTWTNPTSAYWRGTLILRRTDTYPQGPNDPAATIVYNGRAATATDSALTVGDTGYYAAYAYARGLWAAPDTTSGTRTAITYLLWNGSGTGRWKAGP